MNQLPFAFFDVDETIVDQKTMFSFHRFYFSRARTGGTEHRVEAFRHALDAMRMTITSREEVNKRFYMEFAGEPVADVRAAVQAWFAQERAKAGFYIETVCDVLRLHQAHGIAPVFVSGSWDEILAPIAADLGVRHVLASRLRVADGRYTGELLDPPRIGKGKAQAVLAFAAENGVDLSRSFAYGDHISDLDLLQAVAHPTVVAGDEDLDLLAQAKGWPSIARVAQVETCA